MTNQTSKGFQALRGELYENHLLAPYTSWRVGGPARRCYRPADLSDLAVFLRQLPSNEQVVWLGLGSNVLIREGGIDGTVILTLGRLTGLEVLDENAFRAEAGVTCSKIARYCVQNNLAKGAFFAGIPGTVGGALAMNAGAFGGETWRYVTAVETLNQDGEIQVRSPDEFRVAYREVVRPRGEWFVAGHFRFPLGDGKKADDSIRGLLKKRSSTQPIGEYSCGCVFRNPPNDFAARLIEASGLKGKQIGGASVSMKHANFIINQGDATATDIEQLIEFVADQVEQQQGVRLVPEVHRLGEMESDEKGQG